MTEPLNTAGGAERAAEASMSRQGGTRGPLAVGYVHDGRSWAAGGFTADQAEWMVARLAARGCIGFVIRDGLEYARALLPPGTRVIASRKHWGSQVGTVLDGYEVSQGGEDALVRFDDGAEMTWWLTGLAAVTGHGDAAAGVSLPVVTVEQRPEGAWAVHRDGNFLAAGGTWDHARPGRTGGSPGQAGRGFALREALRLAGPHAPAFATSTTAPLDSPFFPFEGGLDFADYVLLAGRHARDRAADPSRAAAGTEQGLTAASAGPYIVTGWFTTNVGPSLHYSLQDTAGRELDYWRMPDGAVGAQIRSGDRWVELDPGGPRYQAVVKGVREYEATNPDLAGYNNPQAATAAGDAPGERSVPRSTGPGDRVAPGTPATESGPAAGSALEPPGQTADRYVVARINKTYGTHGRHPGPQDVGKTLMPYDDRHLSKEAAEESAANSNDRYRPSLHGKTYIAVRAEPIPGTNRFRNLDHPSLAAKAAPATRAAEIKAEAAKYGLTVIAKLSHDFNPATGEMDGKVIDATVTVEGTFTPGDRRAYLAAEANANTVLGMVRMVRPGSAWGTDSASVGGHAGMTGGYVRMNKSGAEIAVARHLAPARRPAEGSNPATARKGSATARNPALRRTGRQVQPRTRGRTQ